MFVIKKFNVQYKQESKDVTASIDSICCKMNEAFENELDLKKKIKFVKDACYPDKVEELINDTDCFNIPLWYYFLKDNDRHWDLFNHYSKHIKKNQHNLKVFLYHQNSLSMDNSWFPKEKIANVIESDIFEIDGTNMKYAIDNMLIKNIHSIMKRVTDNIKNSHINFLTTLQRDLSVKLKVEALNLLGNHYYDKTGDVELLNELCTKIISEDMFRFKKSKGTEIHNFTGKFREIILEKYLDFKAYRYYVDNDRIFKEIMDNKEFPQYKNIIYKNCKHPDLLTYGLITDYFSKEDLISFINDESYKNEAEKYYFGLKINKSESKKKIKM